MRHAEVSQGLPRACGHGGQGQEDGAQGGAGGAALQHPRLGRFRHQARQKGDTDGALPGPDNEGRHRQRVLLEAERWTTGKCYAFLYLDSIFSYKGNIYFFMERLSYKYTQLEKKIENIFFVIQFFYNMIQCGVNILFVAFQMLFFIYLKFVRIGNCFIIG